MCIGTWGLRASCGGVGCTSLGEGISTHAIGSDQSKGKIFRQPAEAQCTAEGKPFSARSAEQFWAGASDCLSYVDKGLRRSPNALKVSRFLLIWVGEGILFPSKPRLSG